MAFTEYAYDNLAIGAAPTKGNLTRTRAYSQVTPTAAYVDATTAYDTWGRPTSVTDPNGRTTTTAYHAFYGYAQSVTNALSQTSSTVVDPGWGAPTSVTDLNGRVTTVQYDPFGRLVKVWLPTEPTNGPASKEFVYAPGDAAGVDQDPAAQGRRDQRLPGSLGLFRRPGPQPAKPGPAGERQSQRDLHRLQRARPDRLQQRGLRGGGAAGSGYVAPTWTNLANYAYTTYDELGRTVRNETRSGATQLWATRATYDVWTTSATTPTTTARTP